MKRRGFTIVELLVTISVLGILMAFIIPAVQAARETARRTECQNKLKQLGIGLHSYESQNRHFPSGKDSRERGWPLALLGFMEQSALAEVSREAFPLDPSSYGAYHPSGTVVGAYVCPTDTRTHKANWASSIGRPMAHTGYIGVSGIDHTTNDGVMFYESKTAAAAIRDGLSNTLLVGERPPSADFNFGWWYTGTGQTGDGNAEMFMGLFESVAPNSSVLEYEPTCSGSYEYGPGRADSYCDVMHYWSLHAGGANFLMADGSVRLIAYDIDSDVLRAAATRDGSESAQLP